MFTPLVKTSRETIKANLTAMARTINALSDATTEIGIDTETRHQRWERMECAKERLQGVESFLANAFGVYANCNYANRLPLYSAPIVSITVDWDPHAPSETILVE